MYLCYNELYPVQSVIVLPWRTLLKDFYPCRKLFCSFLLETFFANGIENYNECQNFISFIFCFILTTLVSKLCMGNKKNVDTDKDLFLFSSWSINHVKPHAQN